MTGNSLCCACQTFSFWKLSFEIIIDRKNIQDKEKIYYPRHAKKVLDGSFLIGTESPYVAAWEILEERYGNQFTIAKSYRDKPQTRPKMGPKDSFWLGEFVEGAMVHIKALEMVNDCNENRKILS